MENVKFMQSLNKQSYKELQGEAEKRRTTIQELLRNVVIPEWLNDQVRRK